MLIFGNKQIKLISNKKKLNKQLDNLNLMLIDKKKQIKEKDNFTLLQSLFKAKNFYGAPKKFFNKELLHSLYGKRHDYLIINLKFTAFYLKRVFKLIKKLRTKGKKILIIADSADIKFLAGEKTFNIYLNKAFPGFIFLNREWVSGMFTSKFYPLGINKKQIKMVLVIKSSIEQQDLIRELSSFKVPIISFINTDEKLQSIQYPILTNKENIKSLYFLMYLIKNASKKFIKLYE